jgi:hypothetical protein
MEWNARVDGFWREVGAARPAARTSRTKELRPVHFARALGESRREVAAKARAVSYRWVDMSRDSLSTTRSALAPGPPANSSSVVG